MWNRIAAIKQFALVESEFLIQDSMHFIVGKNLQYLCSILNSSLIQWLLSKLIGEAAGGNAGNAENILNLCIPLQEDNVTVNDEQLFAKYGLNKQEQDFIQSQYIQ